MKQALLYLLNARLEELYRKQGVEVSLRYANDIPYLASETDAEIEKVKQLISIIENREKIITREIKDLI